MSDPDCAKAYRTAIVLRAARKREHDNRELAVQSIRGLLDVVRPRATRPMEIEYAQAVAYLALNTLYDRLSATDEPVDQLWTESERAVEAWKVVLPRDRAPAQIDWPARVV
jgi:hypothetical protein